MWHTVLSRRPPYHRPTRLWPEAAEEFAIVEVLIPFAVADLRRPIAHRGSAFDASEVGLGIADSVWPEIEFGRLLSMMIAGV